MDIKELISQGENSGVEFKQSDVRPESVAKEIVAFLNAIGGNILIGVNDDGNISGIDKSSRNWEEWVMNICRDHVNPPVSDVKVLFHKLDEQTILNIQVPKGTNKPYQDNKNQFYIRVGSTNRVASQLELLRLFQNAGAFHYDATSVLSSGFIDLDINKLYRYFQLFELNFQEEEHKTNLLKNVDIMDAEGQLTIAGTLVFAIHPQKYLHNASITFARFDGNEVTDEVVDKKVFEGTLDNQIDQCLASIRANLMYASKIVGAKTEDTSGNYPDKVFRELLVNACVHRDYSITGSRIRVFMFHDRLEVRSPGRLPNSVDVEKIKYGVSYARNPILVKFMENLRYIDKMGRGVPMVVKAAQQLGRTLVLEEVGEEFVVKLGF